MIKNFHSGGDSSFVTYTPFTSATVASTGAPAAAAPDPSGESSSKKSSNSGLLTEKDLLSMVKEIDGLPSDMLVVLDKILRLTQINELIGDTSPGNLASTYLQALGEVKRATWNRKQYDDAYQRAQDTKSLSSIAITQDGRVYAIDKSGNQKIVTVNEFMKGGYTPITNSNLLYMRAHDTSKANMNDVFMTVENGIGMEAVTKMIRDGISNLGSSEVERSGYQSKEAKKGLKLLEEIGLRSDVNIDDLYSLQGLYKTKVITHSQLSQAKQAYEYIWSMLPENAKTLLAINSGNKDNPLYGAKILLSKIVNSTLSSTFSIDPEFLADLNSDGTKKETSKDGKSTDDMDKLKFGPAMQFLEGAGQKEQFPIQIGGNTALMINGTRMPITKNGNPMGAGYSLRDVTTSDYGTMLNLLNASMGGELLSVNGMNMVMVDGTIHSMDLPIDQDAQAKGIIKPDFKMLKAMDEADRYIRENNISNFEEKNKVYAKYNIPAKYTSNGNLNLTNYKRFAVFNAVADQRAFNGDVTFNDNLTEITDRGELDQFEQTVRKASNFSEKAYSVDKISGWDKFWGGGHNWITDHTAVFKGPVFIPIDNNAFGTLNTKVTRNQFLNVSALEAQRDRINNYVNPGTL